MLIILLNISQLHYYDAVVAVNAVKNNEFVFISIDQYAIFIKRQTQKPLYLPCVATYEYIYVVPSV